jgi:two-component system nitrogen regulation response regulator GlnG
MADILIVDDDQSVATAFERFLKHEGHACTLASNAEDALRLVGERDPDLVVMDIKMPGTDGLQALQQIRAAHPDIYVVMMTAYGTSQTSIDAIRGGAFEYLTKPLDLNQLRAVIERALTARRSRDQVVGVESEALPTVALVGDTAAMHEAYKLIGRLATLDVPALILGARGTGRELVAATIHANSSRRDRPFIDIDCASVGAEMIETELFAPALGTVHLGSVHALPKPIQVRLARELASGHSRSMAPKTLSARVIASTDRDLGEVVAADAFSQELYEALAVVTIRLPPLRERRDDIPLLVRHFIQRFNSDLDRRITGVDDQVMRRLQEHQWPGNVAELESVLKRACIVTRGDVITLDDIGERLSDSRFPGRHELDSALTRAVRAALQERIAEQQVGASSSAFHDVVNLVETALVREALTITNGNQVKASELLGVNRATLRKKSSVE